MTHDLSYVLPYPEAHRAVVAHQLMSSYGASLTPDAIDSMDCKTVQLLRYCMAAESHAAKVSTRRAQYYHEAGIKPASLHRG